jgi:hypothetical protein
MPVTHVDNGVEVKTRAARHVIDHTVRALPEVGTARDVSIQAISWAVESCKQKLNYARISVDSI